ncbi:MAG: autotransporter-associated beta strand repeat-containing protein, partial [Rhodocyclaceae bacterium]|nr:autotransporter-associated beta strand repeat-containing protein [Rhodocyclaceae bacterium]
YGKNGASGNSAAEGKEDVIVTNSYTQAYGGISEQDTSMLNSTAPAANNNALILQTGAIVHGTAYGGYHRRGGGSATATGNTVALAGGTSYYSLIGGSAFVVALCDPATANDNTVLIQNGQILTLGLVQGGRAVGSTATASGNKVEVTGGTVGATGIFGGYASGANGSAAANNNTVILNGGSYYGMSNIYVYGGWAEGNMSTVTATVNTITLGAAFEGKHDNISLWGGYTEGRGDAVTGNTLLVNTGAGKRLTVGGVNNFEYLSFIHAGDVRVGALSNIGVAPNDISLRKKGTGTLTLTAAASNYVGSTVVFAGTLELADPGAAGTNWVDVRDGATLRLSASGAYTNALITGNPYGVGTLEVTNTGVSVQKILGFQNLYFILPAATAAGATMLEVTGGAATVFAQMTNIGVAIAGGGSVLKMGDQVTLLTNADGLQNSSGTDLVQGTDYQQVNLTGRQGISLDYGFALDNDANSIFAQVTTVPKPKPTPQPQPKPQPQPDPKPQPQPTPPQPQPQPEPQPQPAPQVNPQTKAIPEGRAAGMGMLNLGADQIVRMTGNLPNRTGGGGVFDRSGGPLG